MKFAAGIVLYNPDLDRLRENLDAIVPQAEEVVLVDNASKNLSEVKKMLEGYPKCSLVCNEKNEGIARALNQILAFAKSGGYEWFLTLDQDSVCKKDLLFVYSRYVGTKGVAIITSRAVDRNFTVENSFKEEEEYKYVTYCITSGALMNTALCAECGGWDDKMFIDNVDGDICINFKTHGYKVLSVNYDGILHEVGHGKDVRFLWIKDCVYNHPAWRQYYMARNRIYAARKYPEEFKIRKELKKEWRNFRLILLFEEDKGAKLKARLKGIKDGFAMQIDR